MTSGLYQFVWYVSFVISVFTEFKDDLQIFVSTINSLNAKVAII